MTAPEEPTPAKNGRGGFFAVDRRAWHLVCGLGMNAAVAYLVLARGTGGDNRTTKWSGHAIEERTGISRSRAHDAIRVLERAGAVQRDPASKPSRPKYKVVPANEISGCEGAPLPPLDAEQERVYIALGAGWTRVPKSIRAQDTGAYQRWRCYYPHGVAERLVKSGHAKKSPDGQHFQAVRYDAEAAARPDWIWLANELVEGAANEVPPVELIRQTGNVRTLRLLINLYGSQVLDENGGIHFRHIRQSYTRHKVGEQGSLMVWGFVPGVDTAWSDSPFVAPHLAAAASKEAGWEDFWGCWRQLRNLGLVGFVGHLVHADTPEGEIIHPVARTGEGLEIEQQVGVASSLAATALITEGQVRGAERQGVVMLAPVQRHIEQVQMVGIARLRYRPLTSRTQAFAAREAEWRAAIDRLMAIVERAEHGLATSRPNQGTSR